MTYPVADPVMHLLRRATFGPTPELHAEVTRTGTRAWVEAQLTPTKVKDAEMDAFARRFPRLTRTPRQVRAEIGYGWELMLDYLDLHVARNLWSRRQLLEVVADFWGDHLVVPAPNSEAQATLHTWHRDVIRTHALGKFGDLLKASARHPAMLAVLDNGSSRKDAPNENYGRELLELHTVGVGGYTEADVLTVTRALTGLSTGHEGLEYEFKPSWHHTGRLSVLGWSHTNSSAAGGEKVALSLLDHLARHPRTAQRIARKLAVRFVTDNPTQTYVDELARRYLRYDTAIAPLLRDILTGSTFQRSAGQKTRRPYEDVVATLRILGHGPDPQGVASLSQLRWHAGNTGHVPGGWSAPNGYPDQAAHWVSAAGTLARWNIHMLAAAGWAFEAMRQPDLRSWLPRTPPKDHATLVTLVADRLLLPPLSRAQRDAVCAFLDKAPGDPVKADAPALGRRLPYVVALLLDTPNFTVR